MPSVLVEPAPPVVASRKSLPNVPVLALLKVRLPPVPDCPTNVVPPEKVDPAPSTVTPAAPLMFTCDAPDETVPPAATLRVLPPEKASVPVVVNVDPAPVTTIVDAVESV